MNNVLSSGPVEHHSNPHSFFYPLTRVVAGTAVRIKRLAAPPEVSKRLREMGFCEDQQIKLVSRHPAVICQVCNARLGLSVQLAESIFVEALPVQSKVR